MVLGNLTCAQETRWLHVAWWTRTFLLRSSNWIIPNTAHAQSVDYPRVGRSMFCHAVLTTQFPWVHVRVLHATRSNWVSWSQVRLPRTKNLKKNRFKIISRKNHIAIPMTKGSGKTLTMSKGFDAFMVNYQCGSLMRERFVSWDCTQSPALLRFM